MKKLLRVPDYLEHMLTAIVRIQTYTATLDVQGFKNTPLIQDAVIRNVEVIGEAANNIQRVHPDFAHQHPEIPWQLMYAMRNRLSHGYDAVDLDLVWRTISENLPELYRLVKSAQQAR